MGTALMVLGAQRSGTSVVSHVLSRLGFDFGNEKDFIQDNHNPIFFELKWVNDYNNQLVDQLGHQYIDFFLPIEEDFENQSIAAIAHELESKITQTWNGTPAIGIKDPRFSLTFPVWQDVLSNVGYDLKNIIVFRSPLGFLKSNKKLFHNWEGWNDERHLQFWLQFNLAAVYFTRNSSVHFVNYDNLMIDPIEETRKITQFLNLDTHLSSDAARVVDSSYYHHQAKAETEFSFVNDCYQHLCERTLSPSAYLKYRDNPELQNLVASTPVR